MPGPVPKRTAERRRRNRTPGQTSVAVAGAVRPPRALKEWHPLARRWYNSLKTSGQSQFYEPTDWAFAMYIAQVMSTNLEQERFSATLFAAVLGGMESLLSTEASRRRARLEIERELGPAAEAGPTVLDEYREKLTARAVLKS